MLLSGERLCRRDGHLEGRWPKFVRWTFLMFLPLVATGLVLFARVAGLPERLMILRTNDIGWRIPALSPEGWLGMVPGAGLDGFSVGTRVILGRS